MAEGLVPLEPVEDLLATFVGDHVLSLVAYGERVAGQVAKRPRPSISVLVRFRRSDEHTSELQSRQYLVCRLLLEKKKTTTLSRCQLHRSAHGSPALAHPLALTCLALTITLLNSRLSNLPHSVSSFINSSDMLYTL